MKKATFTFILLSLLLSTFCHGNGYEKISESSLTNQDFTRMIATVYYADTILNKIDEKIIYLKEFDSSRDSEKYDKVKAFLKSTKKACKSSELINFFGKYVKSEMLLKRKNELQNILEETISRHYFNESDPKALSKPGGMCEKNSDTNPHLFGCYDLLKKNFEQGAIMIIKKEIRRISSIVSNDSFKALDKLLPEKYEENIKRKYRIINNIIPATTIEKILTQAQKILGYRKDQKKIFYNALRDIALLRLVFFETFTV